MNDFNKKQYDSIEAYSAGLAVVELNAKYGYINEAGNEVIAIEYDEAFSFSEDGIAVVYDKHYGYGIIDKTGRRIVPLKYDEIDDHGVCDGLIAVSINEKWGFVNMNGDEIVPLVYDEVSYFNSGLAIVGVGSYYFSEEMKYGVINVIGIELVEPKYDEIIDCENGVFEVRMNNKWGLIDHNGKEITPIKYDCFDEDACGNYLIMAEIGGRYGLINVDGKEVTPIKYDWIDEYYGDATVVGMKENGKFGFVDVQTGKEVVSAIYENILDFKDGFAPVKLNGKWGFIDQTGKRLTPFLFDEITVYKGNHRWGTFKDNSFGVLCIRCVEDASPLAENDWEWEFIEDKDDLE